MKPAAAVWLLRRRCNQRASSARRTQARTKVYANTERARGRAEAYENVAIDLTIILEDLKRQESV
jgi:hypothetical protein